MSMPKTLVPVLLLLLLVPGASSGSSFATIYNFTNFYPIGLTYNNGALYGTFEGVGQTGAYCGTVFKLQPPGAAGGLWTETTLYSFAAISDACIPVYAPAFGADGAIYGVSTSGGAYNNGAIYQLRPPASPGAGWTERIIFDLGAPGANIGVDGGPLMPGQDGSFYLLTSGGVHGSGGMLHLLPPASPDGAWTTKLVYSFPFHLPALGVVPGPNGVFYGTTLYESVAGGLIFQLSPPVSAVDAWTITALYTIPVDQGATPNSLTVDSDGTIYGTTYGLNQYGYGPGTVFSLTPPASSGGIWTYTLLKNFATNHPDQSVIVHNGNVYGAIATNKGGAVFELQAPSAPGGEWTSIFLHGFTNGQVPGVALVGGAFVMGADGIIYGATQDNYAQPIDGTVYRIATQ